jgi:hypothetical protein
MKKTIMAAVFVLLVVSGALAQSNPSINIVNYTGNDIRVIRLKYTIPGSEEGRIIITRVKNGESDTIELPEPLSKVNRYNIEVEDVNGKKTEKNNVTVSANARIEFGTPPPPSNEKPRITIVNNTGETINAVSIRYAGSDWVRYGWPDNRTIANGTSFNFTMPNPLNTVNRYDIRLERPNSLGTYTKNSVTVSHGGNVEFTSSNKDATTPAVTPNTPQQNPSITIFNNTVMDINSISIRQHGSDKWTVYKLPANQVLRYRQTYSLQLPNPINAVNRYDIKLERPDGRTYTKSNVTVSANSKIEFEMHDIDRQESDHILTLDDLEGYS